MQSTHFVFPLETLQTVEINPCEHLFPTALLVPVSLRSGCFSKTYRNFGAVCPHLRRSRRCYKVTSRVILTYSKSLGGKKYPVEERGHGNAVWPWQNASSAIYRSHVSVSGLPAVTRINVILVLPLEMPVTAFNENPLCNGDSKSSRMN